MPDKKKRVNYLINLPLDILTYILKLLSLKDLCRLMQTCVGLRNIIVENYTIWRSLSQNVLIIEDPKIDYPPVHVDYHALRTSYNWRRGIYQSKQLVNMKKKYMPWIRFCPDILLLSVGSELQCYGVNKKGIPQCNKPLWTLDVPPLKTIDIRTTDISRFIIKDNLIVCGYRHGDTNLYKVDDRRQQPRLVQSLKRCHRNGLVEVTAVDIICKPGRSFMVTGSEVSDKLALWIWPKDDGTFYNVQDKCVIRRFKDITLTGYKGARSLALNNSGTLLAVGPESSNTPFIIDMKTMTVKPKSCKGWLVDVVRDIQWHDENTIAYINHNGTVALMDIRSGVTVYEERDPFRTPLYCVKTDGNNAIVVGSSEYSRCVLYDRRMKNHVQMYFTQKVRSPVYGLDFNSTKLVAAIDRCMTVLDFDVPVASSKPRDYSLEVFSSDR